MLNLLIVRDNEADDIGQNCELSYNYLSQSVRLEDYITNVLDGMNCDAVTIQNLITSFNESPFIFIAFSHGNDGYLKAYHYGEYVNVTNSYFFAGSLFYTNACCSAGELSDALIYNNCKAFIGYCGDVNIPEDETYSKKFIECENYAITEFLTSEKQLSLCLSEMKQKYIDVYDEISGIDARGAVQASLLIQNLDNLTWDGDLSITRQYFAH